MDVVYGALLRHGGNPHRARLLKPGGYWYVERVSRGPRGEEAKREKKRR